LGEITGLRPRSVGSGASMRNDPDPAKLARSSSAAPVRVRAHAADALSEVLRLVRLTGAVFLNAELTAPWAVQTPSAQQLAAKLMPNADWLVEYHLIVEGRCWLRLGDGEPVALNAGDLVMLPHGDSHRLSSEPGLETQAAMGTDLALPTYGEIVQSRYGGGGAVTRIACGYFAIDRRLCRGLIAALPPVLRIDAADGDLRHWLHTYMQLRAANRGGFHPGGACVLSKLSELMFVEAVRRYVESLPHGQTGWLAGLRDPHVGQALGLIHQAPAKPWTIEGLGRAVGLSRSALAERFTALIGQPPMQYLTQWRLTLAAHRLQVSQRPAGSVAEEVGYDSEAAFSRAFKREYGMPPAAWRRHGSGLGATAPS
jgi:AraC-like DNA-binding protein/mannose-6-phosphate isomerase-like protein (cupin superfamily)